MNTSTVNTIQNDLSWQKIIMRYNQPDMRKSVWQIINSFIPFAGIWFLMYLSLQFPYWVTLLLALPAAGFLVRLFIIFHDCGHGSFFKSKKINDLVGKMIGIIVFTPYSSWHYSHAVHHATAGNLDKRGEGDVWTLTVSEYNAASKRDKLIYRVYRNPWVMFFIGSVVIILRNRLTRKSMSRKDKQNIYFTNIALLIISVSLILLIGIKAFLLIQFPVLFISHVAGIWLFYIQHQFDDVYWDRGEVWDYKSAAVHGSSFLKLPSVLQWFTGNIGFHHVHHLSPRIPNYNLEKCHYENEIFKDIQPITLFSSFKALNLRLWDEVTNRMVSIGV